MITELTQGWGNRLSEGKNKTLCTPFSWILQEKGAVTPQETDPDLPASVQESLVEAWVGVGLLQGQGTEYSSVSTRPLEGGHHDLHHLHHSLVSGQTTGREHSPARQQKIGLNIY